MSEHFWRGFWTQMRAQAPIVVVFGVLIILAAIWELVK